MLTEPITSPNASLTGTGAGPGVYTVLLPGTVKLVMLADVAPTGRMVLDSRLALMGEPLLTRSSSESKMVPACRTLAGVGHSLDTEVP